MSPTLLGCCRSGAVNSARICLTSRTMGTPTSLRSRTLEREFDQRPVSIPSARYRFVALGLVLHPFTLHAFRLVDPWKSCPFPEADVNIRVKYSQAITLASSSASAPPTINDAFSSAEAAISTAEALDFSGFDASSKRSAEDSLKAARENLNAIADERPARRTIATRHSPRNAEIARRRTLTN
jgi:hypothetical protein